MTQLKDNINSQTGKHLTYEERVKIEAYKELDYSNREIDRILNRAPQMINNAVNHGTVRSIKQRPIRDNKVYEYDQYSHSADAEQQIHIRNGQHSGRRLKWLLCDSFTDWADAMMLDESWSPDIIIGRALKEERFAGHLIPCTSTLYNWIDRGIMKTKTWIYLKKSRESQEMIHLHIVRTVVCLPLLLKNVQKK